MLVKNNSVHEAGPMNYGIASGLGLAVGKMLPHTGSMMRSAGNLAGKTLLPQAASSLGSHVVAPALNKKITRRTFLRGSAFATSQALQHGGAGLVGAAKNYLTSPLHSKAFFSLPAQAQAHYAVSAYRPQLRKAVRALEPVVRNRRTKKAAVKAATGVRRFLPSKQTMKTLGLVVGSDLTLGVGGGYIGSKVSDKKWQAKFAELKQDASNKFGDIKQGVSNKLGYAQDDPFLTEADHHDKTSKSRHKLGRVLLGTGGSVAALGGIGHLLKVRPLGKRVAIAGGLTALGGGLAHLSGMEHTNLANQARDDSRVLNLPNKAWRAEQIKKMREQKVATDHGVSLAQLALIRNVMANYSIDGARVARTARRIGNFGAATAAQVDTANLEMPHNIQEALANPIVQAAMLELQKRKDEMRERIEHVIPGRSKQYQSPYQAATSKRVKKVTKSAWGGTKPLVKKAV